VFVLGLLLLGGCGGGRESSTVLEFWAMGREGEVVQVLLPEFTRRHPTIRVRVQQIPWSAAHEKLLTAYVGNAMPDVFQLGNTWIPEFVALRAITNLDTQIQHSTAVKLEDYFPGILETNAVNGYIYALPWYVDTRLLFYREDILDNVGITEPPTSWANWLEAMSRIKRQLGADRYAILVPINEWQPLVILALQLGAELLKDNDQYGNFRDERFRQAFAFYLALFREGLTPSVGTTQIANLYQEFANGYFAMYITGPWNIGEFRRRLPATTPWLTAPMPGPDDRGGVSLAGGASLAIARSSSHQDAAWKLLEYLSEPTQQSAFYRLSGDLPARKTAWSNPELATDPQVQAFWKQLQHLKSIPKIPEWERIAAKITQYGEAVIRKTLSMDEALAALDRDVDDLLEKRRWLLSRVR
jgi:multiple sugar transport system substrate-binding protein